MVFTPMLPNRGMSNAASNTVNSPRLDLKEFPSLQQIAHCARKKNGGHMAIQTGWQWTGDPSGRRVRIGVQYYNGQHEKLQFFVYSEQKVGVGLWYDF